MGGLRGERDGVCSLHLLAHEVHVPSHSDQLATGATQLYQVQLERVCGEFHLEYD